MERPKGLKGIPAQRRATFLLFPVNKKEKKMSGEDDKEEEEEEERRECCRRALWLFG